MIQGILIPLSCPRCTCKIIATRYELTLKILKVRSWQICTECNFQQSANDFKNSLLTV